MVSKRSPRTPSAQSVSGMLSQPLEQSKRRIAVRREAVSLLIGAQRRLTGLAEPAVDLADIIAHFLEPDLHVAGLRQRQAAIMDRPGAKQLACAHGAIAEQSDGEGVGGRIVVALDDLEIGRHQENWPAQACRNQQLRLASIRQGL